MATSPEDREAALRVCKAVKALNTALTDAAQIGIHIEVERNDVPARAFQQFSIAVMERREKIIP